MLDKLVATAGRAARLYVELACPDENLLVDFASGTMLPEARERLENHADSCPGCFEALAAIACAHGADDSVGSDEATNRYRIERQLGSGAMGTVYEVHDSVLDRRVALKVLRDDRPMTEQRRLRLLREAQSLARIRHPSVVTVHDAGEFAGQVYIAMELVDGKRLDDFLADARPSWREIVRLFIRAGTGLVAAHQAHIVHRDFKPANVLVESSGRVVITDFGLAAASEAADSDRTTLRPQEPSSLLAERLSTTGTALGTPAYMAPEQCRGQATEHSDQFAYCVALVEALTGTHPLALPLAKNLDDAHRRGPQSHVLAQIPGPRILRQAVARGLRYAPEDRHPSMRELLGELRKSLRVRRTRRVAAALATMSVAAGVASWGLTRPPTGCEDPLEQVWAHQGAVERTLLAEDLGPRAARSGRMGVERLREHGSELEASFVEVCAGLPRSIEAATSLQRAQWTCLQRQRHGLVAVTTAIVEGPRSQLPGLLRATDLLRNPAECRDPTLAASWAPEPEDSVLGAQIREARLRLVLARVRGEAGDDVTTTYRDLLDTAQTLAYPPLEAEIRLQLGLAELYGRGFEAGIGHLKTAYGTALHSRHQVLAAYASRLLVIALRFVGRFDEARTWAEAARPLQRATWEQIEFEVACGMMETTASDLDAASKHFEQARALRAACGPCELAPDRLDALLHSEYGELLLMQGNPREAMKELKQAIDLDRKRLGPAHIAAADNLASYGSAAMVAGEPGKAREALLEATAIADELGLAVPVAHATLAQLHASGGDHASALQSFRQARASEGRSPLSAAIAVDEAQSLAQLGHTNQARSLCDEARGQLSEFLGPDHDRVKWASQQCHGLPSEVSDER